MEIKQIPRPHQEFYIMDLKVTKNGNVKNLIVVRLAGKQYHQLKIAQLT